MPPSIRRAAASRARPCRDSASDRRTAVSIGCSACALHHVAKWSGVIATRSEQRLYTRPVRWPLLFVALTACGSDPAPTALFELDAPIDTAETYWDLPFPSDLRLAASGAPDIAEFPNPRDTPILRSLLSSIDTRRGWSTMPVAYFRFSAALPAYDLDTVIDPASDHPAALLIDIYLY